MNPIQATAQPVPLEPTDHTIARLREEVAAGEKVAALDPEGLQALFAAVAGRQRVLTANLMNKPATDAGAEYAQVTGHLKGLAEIEGIAVAVVERGKNAALELKAAEEKEDS